jgi:hypothetical protein
MCHFSFAAKWGLNMSVVREEMAVHCTAFPWKVEVVVEQNTYFRKCLCALLGISVIFLSLVACVIPAFTITSGGLTISTAGPVVTKLPLRRCCCDKDPDPYPHTMQTLHSCTLMCVKSSKGQGAEEPNFIIFCPLTDE